MLRKNLAPLMLAVLLAGQAHADGFFFSEPQTPAAPGIQIVDETDAAPSQEGAVEILLTAGGDVTIGGNMLSNPKSNMYTKIVDAAGGDLSYFFANVYDIFSQDDITLVNFEGTLTNETKAREGNEFRFRAPPEHVQALTLSSVEAVALENNHVQDFGEAGYADTVQTLTDAGIVYASESSMGVYEAKGISIALLAYQTFDGAYERIYARMPGDIAAARAEHDIVIVSYHWGTEGAFSPNERQVPLGRATIDAGADLVLGHHSHRIQPIEQYKGKYIVYSLANCVFSGNTRPDNMDTFLFQLKFLVTDGEVTTGDFRIIPCSISSISGQSGAVSAQNDLQVTPFEPGCDAERRVIDMLSENSAGLDYAVTEYPTQWQ